MRYATAHPAGACQARSLRIGRCARCHAPVLCNEEHYGAGSALVHGACGTQSLDPTREPGSTTSSRSAGNPARRLRRMGPATRLQTPVSPGKL